MSSILSVAALLKLMLILLFMPRVVFVFFQEDGFFASYAFFGWLLHLLPHFLNGIYFHKDGLLHCIEMELSSQIGALGDVIAAILLISFQSSSV